MFFKQTFLASSIFLLTANNKHNNYTFVKESEWRKGYDVAIWVLKEDVTINENVKVVTLPEPSNLAKCPSGKVLVVSGWGKDKYRPTRDRRHLWAVEQECLNVSECTYYTGDPKVILCVGDSKKPANSACEWDNGGKNILVIIEIDKLGDPNFKSRRCIHSSILNQLTF